MKWNSCVYSEKLVENWSKCILQVNKIKKSIKIWRRNNILNIGKLQMKTCIYNLNFIFMCHFKIQNKY